MQNPLNQKYLNTQELNETYETNKPFPHIVLDNFIDENLLNGVLEEFPDLEKAGSKAEFNDSREIKAISRGFADISPKAFKLISYLNSDLFLTYLQEITGIKELLISDPYLLGGGYHQTKRGGLLKIHADFNKHTHIDLDRRVNLLLYLNPGWKKEWKGELELYDEHDLKKPVVSIEPIFNRCVIFSTTSFSYHGNPDPLECPIDQSRKSLALYYYSSGRPESEINNHHGTLFVGAKGERVKKYLTFRSLMTDLIPPLFARFLRKLLRKKNAEPNKG